MSDFLTGLGTGFAQTVGDNIGARKADARDYFNKQMELAHAKAYEFNKVNAGKMNSSLMVAKQLQAVGVPEDVVMAVANQNPDDLPGFLELVQKQKADGVPTSPEYFRSLMGVDSELNPGGENITSLMKKIYTPLKANVAADPEGFEFDPRGHVWASAMGYNAMDKARAKLASTEVMDGMTAADLLYGDPNEIQHPLGDSPVVMDAAMAGEAGRAAKASRDAMTPQETLAVVGKFDDLTTQISSGREWPDHPDGTPMSDEERLNVSRAEAAGKIVADVPSAANIPSISKWLPKTEEATGAPGTAPTAPVDVPATTLAPPPPPAAPEAAAQAPKYQFVKDNGDGTSTWMIPGVEGAQKVRNADVKKSPSMRLQAPGELSEEQTVMQNKKPASGWMDDKFGG